MAGFEPTISAHKWLVLKPPVTLRQSTVTDLEHENHTLLLTNYLDRPPSQLIGRYAQRMLVKNNVEDGIDFFHIDALSSAVAIEDEFAGPATDADAQ